MLFRLLVFPGFLFLLVCALFLDWVDRRIIARFQGRVGPPWYQPVADLIKLLAKEDILPTGVNHVTAAVLPMISLAAVLTAGLYIPVANISAASFEGDLIVVLFLLSIPALAYFLAGWISVGVYSVLGGSRALLQYFSYEVPFLMALAGPAILSGSWSIMEIVAYQAQTIWSALMQPLGFVLALVGLIGKLKRDPLDIPKAKSEVVAGSLTEFSGRKLALWHLTMNIQTVVGIFLLVNLFFGQSSVIGALPAFLSFGLKALGIMLLLSTASALYARLRIDQLATLGWRVLAPLALLQILVVTWIGG
ncbi:MAG TPA: NADH-quinone oxidoreductase subunit H [Anaerolineae bacterium]|nr:NADH-quinone oxidoreductase subunit H [Anaerolineae bacterium]HQI83017.1 NADH-quinone oxidoreductase subunit H [Anaerolineae bacterium]